jgi:hypothetical protein
MNTPDFANQPKVSGGWEVIRHHTTKELSVFWNNPDTISWRPIPINEDGSLKIASMKGGAQKTGPAINATFLDNLLKEQSRIPEAWKAESRFFLGTIYRNCEGDRVVRYLVHYNGLWRDGYYRLGVPWQSESTFNYVCFDQEDRRAGRMRREPRMYEIRLVG